MNIALAGKMKSGKSTLAQALEELDLCTSILSFSQPIRDGLKVMGITKAPHPELYRKGAQYLGTDLVRAEYPDWWIDLARKKILHDPWYSDDHVTIVVDDCRFENEFEALKDLGFLMVWLDVSEATQLSRGAEPDRLTHASETGLDHISKEEWDLWLPESSSVQERLETIRSVRENYILPPN